MPTRRADRPLAAAMAPLALTLALAAGCAVERADPGAKATPAVDQAAAATAATTPDLALLWVSGLRADAPGADGAEAAFFQAIPLTPAVRYHGVYAQSASPFISLGTVLTGRYASAIPMCGTYVGGAASAEGRAWCADIPDDRVTLPELLSLYGYRTALVTAGKPEMEAIADEFQTWIDVPPHGAEATVDWGELQGQVQTWWSADSTSPRLLVVVADDLSMTAIPRMQAELGLGQRMRRGIAGGYDGLTDEDRVRARTFYADAGA